MELKFDKEMDALLRKARSGTSVAAVKGGHLDADSIAAFAEGAVPEAVRKTYTAHFADCDSCRKSLSYVALLNERVASKAAVAAPAPWQPNAVPWYRSLFRTPGLAAAFGVLVLAFGGALVYLVTQRGANTSDSVAMESNKASSNLAVPYAGIEDTNSTADAASTMSNTAVANAASNAVNRSAANASSNTASNSAPGNEPVSTGYAGGAAPSGTSTVQQPVAAAPPPADAVAGRDTGGKPAEDKPKTSTEERKDKDEDQKETTRGRALRDDSLARGEVATKKAVGGPQRSGPVQNQVQNNIANGEMLVARKVGGKTFHNSGGAWYDSAYHNQPTTNVRRGTDDFKKLDSGLRSIANDLGGVVVIVWKDKAYRIQ